MKRNRKSLQKRNGYIKYLFLSLFFSLTFISYAQINVRGKVTDAKGEALIGVNVLIKDTRQGTVTDYDGVFSLQAPNSNSILEFSYVGYKAQEISLNGRANLDVVLEEDTELLDEVIVVGYGTQKKVSLTGSVAQINAEDVIKAPSGNISNVLAGKLPGLVTAQRSGRPGFDSSSMLIRGSSTLGDNSATVIVDGVQRGFDNLDPNEIESISILKDASSAAVYGVQGASGVILVTTKRGRDQKPQITYSGKMAYNQNTNMPKFLDGPDFVKYHNKAREMDGLEPLFSKEFYDKLINGDPEGKIANTDWFGEFLKPGSWATHHNINVNGGTGNSRYFISLGYLNQDGIVDKINFNRYNLRSNIDVNLSAGLTLGLDLSARQETRKGGYFGLGNEDWNNPITMASRTLPIVPIQYDGLYTASNMYSGNVTNPFAYNNLTGYSNSVMNILQSSIKLGWDIPGIEGLNVNVKLSYDKDYTTSKAWKEPFNLNFFNPVTQEYTVVAASLGEPNTEVLSKGIGQAQRTTIQPAINYANTFGKHDFSGLLLFEGSKYESENIWTGVQDFDLTTLHELDRGNKILGETKQSSIAGGSYVFPRAGFVGRINYNYDTRYLLELAARYDGSSRFPADRRWGFFPAASAGWRISEEAFFAPYRDKVDNLKLRASAGLLGNDRIADFQYLTLMMPNPPTVYFGNKEAISIYSGGNVNREITWEKTATYNIGLELMLARGIFGMEFDYFYKVTNDILIGGGGLFPPSLGGNYPATINGGKVANRGIELILTHNNRLGEFNYSVRGNLGWSRNKVLYMNESPNVPDYLKSTGYKMGRKVGFIAEGLFQSEEEILNSPTLDHISKSLIRPGDIKYKDINGDGRINSAQDYAFIGSNAFPELMFGLNLNASWKNFDAIVFFQGAAITDMALSGYYSYGVVDNTQYTRAFYGEGNSPYFLIEDSWTPENTGAEFTRLTTQLNGNPNGWPSSWWLRDASYVRLKNAQIGYTLKNALLKNIGVENIRFSLTGSNLFTWSALKKYGIDPEAPEVTNGYYPQQKVYEFGLSITL